MAEKGCCSCFKDTGMKMVKATVSTVDIPYTIEEHLRSFRDDENYNILYSSWKLEKKEYENRLKNVNIRYQTYSVHDASHSETILRQIEFFLGKNRIKQLSPTDTWLILECAYCHDLGMIVTAHDLYNELSSYGKDDFDELSKRMYESNNADVVMAWSYLEPLFRHSTKKICNDKCNCNEIFDNYNNEKYKNLEDLISIFRGEWYEWPMHFVSSFMVLIQEWCRPKHAEMSYTKIVDEMDEKTYDGLIPRRLRYLIADISKLHTDERENVIATLSREVQGFYVDYAHPRFVAMLLRIGDLLDLDNNRFNKYQLAVSGNPSYNSFAHQLKHHSMRDFLITPEEIEVTANFRTDDAMAMLQNNLLREIFDYDIEKDEEKKEKAVLLSLRAFKELSGWLKMLREELSYFSQNWLSIIPKGFSGNCPVFHTEIILLDGENIDKELLDLKYHITAKRAAEIIEGSSLYRNTFDAFVREVLQNSIDATKRRVYRELKKKNKSGFSNPLEFFRYISNDLEQISVSINCTIENKCFNFTIRDNGIGITASRLKGMQHIGNTFDFESIKEAEEMPCWWKPTGSFGIGMQTIFYFTRMFTLMTRTEEDNLLRKMRFHSTQIGGKIDTFFVNDKVLAQDFGYGTKLEIKIPLNIMQRMQERGGLDGVDYFGDEIEEYLSRINMTLQQIIGSLSLPIITLSPISKYPTPDSFLLKSFGRYFINIDNNNSFVTNVLEGKSAESCCDYQHEGFSCWNSKTNILIRYRWIRYEKEYSGENLKIYFNEILVDDRQLQNMIDIKFFNVEVYIFDAHSDDFLEINRDDFLSEKHQQIIDSITETHFECIKLLLSENLTPEYDKYIWESDKKSGYKYRVKCYLNFLLNKTNVELRTDIGLKLFEKINSMILHLHDSNVDFLHTDDIDSIWLTNIKNKYCGHMRLSSTESGDNYYIIEDAMCGYSNLAVNTIKCIEDIYGSYLVLYKTGERKGKVIDISNTSFDNYIKYLYEKNINENNNGLYKRIILPGKSEYEALCVKKLIFNLGTRFEKQFDSAIVLPLTIYEIKKSLDLYEKNNINDFIAIIKNEYIENTNKSSYKKIVNYIKEHRINETAQFDKAKIEEQYIKLILRIIDVLK